MNFIQNLLPVIALFSKGILLLLFGLSIWSFAIILGRQKLFKRVNSSETLAELYEKYEKNELDSFFKAKPLSGPRTQTLFALWELSKNSSLTQNEAWIFDRTFKSLIQGERQNLEAGISTLGTLGSNAPFIGLLGTVLGIIHAFGTLGLGTEASTAQTSSVMTGISEALIATAVGLFVAIPAVIAYNFFSKKLRNILVECEALKDFFLSKHFQKKA